MRGTNRVVGQRNLGRLKVWCLALLVVLPLSTRRPGLLLIWLTSSASCFLGPPLSAPPFRSPFVLMVNWGLLGLWVPLGWSVVP